MDGTVDLFFWQLAAAYIFVLLLIVIVRIRGIAREKEIFIATIRMTLQLILVGYILVYMFDHAHPLLTLLLVAVMLGFAIHTIIIRTKSTLSSRLKRIIAFSMTTGILASLLYFI